MPITPPYPDLTTSPYGFGNAPRGQDPMGPTGTITNTYQPSPQAQLFGRIMEALQDPRNAWIGMGAIRGLGPLRGRLFQPIEREMGGFNVPSKNLPLLEAPRHPPTFAESDQGILGPLMKKTDLGYERAHRNQFIEDLRGIESIVNDASNSADPMKQQMARSAYYSLRDQDRKIVDDMAHGIIKLNQYKRTMNDPRMGGGEPPEMYRRLFGLGE